MSLIDLFRPAPHIDEIQDQKEVHKKYRYWRLRTFFSMYVGYVFFYFTRKSVTFVTPALMQDLGLSLTDIGLLGSVLTITLGISKFLSGVLSDQANPRYFMAVGLMLTGVFNILFGFSSSVSMFVLFWGLNGLFQGWGWPPCARLLTHWYSQRERGTWWGFWNTSHSVGGALIPFIVAFVSQYYGWRSAMNITGWMCIGVGMLLIYFLRDTPQSLGLPAIEKYKNDYPAETIAEEKELNAKEILVKYVLSNKYIWSLGIAYFFIYLIREGFNAWGVIFLMKSKGYSLIAASASVFWFEMGGIVGSLVSGWSSDKLFQGRRGPINTLFSVGVVFAACAFYFVPQGYLVLDYAAMFMVGLFIFGPQMLIGIAAAELSHKKAAGTATGFIGWIAYLGAATAGLPLSKVIERWGWEAFFCALAICGATAAALLAPLWKVKSHPKLTIAKEREIPQEESSIQEG